MAEPGSNWKSGAALINDIAQKSRSATAYNVAMKEYNDQKKSEASNDLVGSLLGETDDTGAYIDGSGVFGLDENKQLYMLPGGMEYLFSSGRVTDSDMSTLMDRPWLRDYITSIKDEKTGEPKYNVTQNQMIGAPKMVRGHIPNYLTEAEEKGLLTEDTFYTAEHPDVKAGKVKVGDIKSKGTKTLLAEWREDIESGALQKVSYIIPVYTDNNLWTFMTRWRSDDESDKAIVFSGNQVAGMIEDATEDLWQSAKPESTAQKILANERGPNSSIDVSGMGTNRIDYNDLVDNVEANLKQDRRNVSQDQNLTPGDRITGAGIIQTEIDRLNDPKREANDTANDLNPNAISEIDPNATTQTGIQFNKDKKRYEKALQKISFKTPYYAAEKHGTTYINQSNVNPFRLFPELQKIKESGTLDGIGSRQGVTNGMFNFWKSTEEGQGVRSTLDQKWKDLIADPERLRVLADNYQLAVQQDLSDLGPLKDDKGEEIPFDLNYFGDFVTGIEDAQVILQSDAPSGAPGAPVQGDKFADTPFSTGDKGLHPRTSNPFPWSYPGYEEGHKQIWESLGSPNIHENELRAIIASGDYPGGPNDTGGGLTDARDFKTLEERKGASPDPGTQTDPVAQTMDTLFPTLKGLEGPELATAIEGIRSEGGFASAGFSPESIAQIDKYLADRNIENADDLKREVESGTIENPYKTSLLMTMALQNPETGLVMGQTLENAADTLFNYITTGTRDKGPGQFLDSAVNAANVALRREELDLAWANYYKEANSGARIAANKLKLDFSKDIDKVFEGSFKNAFIYTSNGDVTDVTGNFDREAWEIESKNLVNRWANMGMTTMLNDPANPGQSISTWNLIKRLYEQDMALFYPEAGTIDDATGKEIKIPAFSEVDYLRYSQTTLPADMKPPSLGKLLGARDTMALNDLHQSMEEWGNTNFWAALPILNGKQLFGNYDQHDIAEYWGDIWRENDKPDITTGTLKDRFVLVQGSDGGGLRLSVRAGWGPETGRSIEGETSLPIWWLVSSGHISPTLMNELISILPVVE